MTVETDAGDYSIGLPFHRCVRLRIVHEKWMIDTGRILDNFNATTFVGCDVTNSEKSMRQGRTARLQIVLCPAYGRSEQLIHVGRVEKLRLRWFPIDTVDDARRVRSDLSRTNKVKRRLKQSQVSIEQRNQFST